MDELLRIVIGGFIVEIGVQVTLHLVGWGAMKERVHRLLANDQAQDKKIESLEKKHAQLREEFHVCQASNNP